MKTIEVYKGFNILEAEGEHLAAGFKFQIELDPGYRHKHKFLGVHTLEKAKDTIDWLAWCKEHVGLD